MEGFSNMSVEGAEKGGGAFSKMSVQGTEKEEKLSNI